MILALPWIPFAGALMILGVPAHRETLLRAIALISTGLSFAITIALFMTFQAGKPGYQFYHSIEWLPSFGIQYQVGLDGINMTLCLLHALVSLAGVFMAIKPKDRLKDYLFFYLLLIAPIYGVFTSLNIFFLYVFYEMTLIPLYPMIGMWGSKNKEYGAMKLTIYITAGAVLSLFGIMLLYREMGSATFDFVRVQGILRQTPLAPDFQKVVAGLFLLGFGVIASLWPLHSWSPIGYAAAPTSVSMLHAGVLKKMGPYLMIRFAIALMPEGVKAWSGILAALAGIGVLYAGFAAIRQKDLKFMVGFSSVSHMGYILLGLAAMTQTSIAGAVMLMFSHGIMAACFFAPDRVHLRTGARSRGQGFWRVRKIHAFYRDLLCHDLARVSRPSRLFQFRGGTSDLYRQLEILPADRRFWRFCHSDHGYLSFAGRSIRLLRACQSTVEGSEGRRDFDR